MTPFCSLMRSIERVLGKSIEIELTVGSMQLHAGERYDHLGGAVDRGIRHVDREGALQRHRRLCSPPPQPASNTTVTGMATRLNLRTHPLISAPTRNEPTANETICPSPGIDVGERILPGLGSGLCHLPRYGNVACSAE